MKRELGMTFDMLTPSENFLQKKFDQKFDGKRWKATVSSFQKGDNSASDMFTLKYRNGTTMPMPKAELVSHLTSETDKLLEDSRWVLRSKLLQFRFSYFTAFMLDLYAAAAKLSCQLQSNSLTIFDVSKSVSKTIASLAALKTTPSVNEAAFLADCKKDMDADIYKTTCHLEDGERGRELVVTDTRQSCSVQCTWRASRVTLHSSSQQARGACLCCVRPSQVARLDAKRAHGGIWQARNFVAGGVVDRFSELFSDTTKDEVLAEWLELKIEILGAPGLMGRKFNELWPHMLVNMATSTDTCCAWRPSCFSSRSTHLNVSVSSLS